MKRYKWTLTGLILALVLWGAIASQDMDVFESVAGLLHRFEHYEINDLFFPILVFYTFMMTDLVRRHEELRVQTEKLRLYRKMIKAVYHIMNNFLQKMLAFRLAAEKNGPVDPNAMKLYDRIISETDEQLQKLGSLESPDEDLIEQVISPPPSAD